MQVLIARIIKHENWPLALLLILHAVGIIGLASPLASYFQLLTPLNLIISVYLLGITSASRNTGFFLFIVAVFLLGYLAEWIGVHYQWLFGVYSYGATLGPQLADVPVIIGINWLIIIFSVGNIMNLFEISKAFKIILGAGLAVLLDIFIEPVAIHFDFWSWENVSPPLQNYTGWFIVSSIMLLIFFQLHDRQVNKTAIAFYFIQLGFFVLLNLKLLLLN